MAPDKGISKTDPPWQQLKLSSKALQSLKTQSSILHLLHHRSKNQHRRSTWYRHFNTFRKQVRVLIDELDPKIPDDAFPSRKVETFQPALLRAEKRIIYWANIMVDKWHDAFQQLIEDRQFAVLGLTLFAILGHVVDTLHILERTKDAGNSDAMRGALEEVGKHVLQHLDKKVKVLDMQKDFGLPLPRPVSAHGEADDTGIPVTRNEVLDLALDELKGSTVVTDVAEPKAAPSEIRVKKRKRKQNSDDIDDLFSGLLG
jgi:hypothetical protein